MDGNLHHQIMRVLSAIASLLAATPTFGIALNKSASTNDTSASSYMTFLRTPPGPKDPEPAWIAHTRGAPHAPDYSENCNAKFVATCLHSVHHITGVERYCPTNNNDNCWDWKKELGHDGSKLKAILSPGRCWPSNFTFEVGYNHERNNDKAPYGFFWGASIQTPLWCDDRYLRKRMDWHGIPE
ncbi:hypothetical protein BT63DRAFT_439232 [Microthyrium microscopicum]|uniref:Uncharacterized protein n=1 Tax=Microthyrium microscopicum TaxID=703497 RepID=A0A6A6UCY8_9PEZI|nr:hypothetical protein BT63DRAFT_439232 [Microthyrium microscopicum]